MDQMTTDRARQTTDDRADKFMIEDLMKSFAVKSKM